MELNRTKWCIWLCTHASWSWRGYFYNGFLVVHYFWLLLCTEGNTYASRNLSLSITQYGFNLIWVCFVNNYLYRRLRKNKNHSFWSILKKNRVMSKVTLYRILGYFLIAIVILVTVRYIIKLPLIIKVLALAVNVITIYYAYNYLIKEKNEKWIFKVL